MIENPLLRVQARSLANSALILDGVRKVGVVHKALRRRVARAFREGVLVNNCTHLIWSKEAWVDLPLEGRQKIISLVGGVDINRDRDPSKAHFKRADGAWFDFHIALRAYAGDQKAHRGSLELLGYGYELRFPSANFDCDVRWLRYDLNYPGHDNEARAVRAHFHPGDEDLQAPSPVIQPEEAVELMLCDLLELPPKRRSADPRL